MKPILGFLLIICFVGCGKDIPTGPGVLVAASTVGYAYDMISGFVPILVQDQAGCGNGDEFKGGDDMSIQECADHCGGAGKKFFAHKGLATSFDDEVGACWCAGAEDEEGGVCGWSSVGTSEYNVYIAVPSNSSCIISWNDLFLNVRQCDIQHAPGVGNSRGH